MRHITNLVPPAADFAPTYVSALGVGRTSALVYCPTGEVIFSDIEPVVGTDHVRSLLTEACDKVNPKGPIKIWRVPDINSYLDYKNVAAYMNMHCMNNDQWEVNQFAEDLASVHSPTLKLRGPIVVVMTHK